MHLDIKPEFLCLRFLSEEEFCAVRRKIRDDYLPVYIDADLMRATPFNASGGVTPAKSYTLSGLWAIHNDAQKEEQDGGLQNLLNDPDTPHTIGFIGKNPPWPEIPGSEFMTLDKPPKLTLSELFIRPRDLLTSQPRENPNAAKRETCLRVALAILANNEDGLRAESTGRVFASRLREKVEARFALARKAVPLSEKVLEELLSAALTEKIPD